MRIIAGSLRGRLLKSTQTSMLRPTTDRVRESIFNILASRIELEDAEVLDLFAGTGALGIEALSRGAAYCEFVERDRKAAAAIAGNLKAFDLEHRSNLIVRDAMKYIHESQKRYDCIFADPPYASPIFEMLVHDLFALGRLRETGVLVLEHSAAMKGIRAEGAEVMLERAFGETGVTIYRGKAGQIR